jgi:hypothetical protein
MARRMRRYLRKRDLHLTTGFYAPHSSNRSYWEFCCILSNVPWYATYAKINIGLHKANVEGTCQDLYGMPTGVLYAYWGLN